jgi:hypothetical protein
MGHEQILIALMMEAWSTSETSASFYRTTRFNNPEDIHLPAEISSQLTRTKSFGTERVNERGTGHHATDAAEFVDTSER